MAYNTTRTTRMRDMSEGALKQRVDSRTLSSAAASAELRRRGVVYYAPAAKVVHQARWVHNPIS